MSAAAAAPPTTIDELQARIVESGRMPSIIEYIELAIKVINANFDLSFAKDLHGMVPQKTCCVPHEYLVKYGVFSAGNEGKDTLRVIQQYGFVEGVDYCLLGNVAEQKGRGGHNKKSYLLHPRAFKICLMRAKNTQKYAIYYILLEECIVYYKDCQNALKNQYIITMTSRNIEVVREKDDKIDQLTALLASFRAENRQQIGGLVTKVDTVVQQNTELQAVANRTEQKLDKVVGIVHEMNAHVGKVADRVVAEAEDVAPPPDDEKKTECLSLVSLGNAAKEYVASRIQVGTLSTRLRKLRQSNPTLREVALFSPSPNASSLWNRAREDLGDRLIMQGTQGTRFRLAAGLTEAQLVARVQAVYDEPKAQAERISAVEKAKAAVRVTTTTTITRKIEVIPISKPSYNLTDAEIDDLVDGLVDDDDDEPGEEGQ